MQLYGIWGVPVEHHAGINRGPGTAEALYHFAFETGPPPALEDWELLAIYQRGMNEPRHPW